MKRLGLACALALLVTNSPRAAGETMKAGAASIDITPMVRIPMWGYASRRDALSEGVMEPLEANALVIAVGDQKLALVGLDLGRAPTRTSMARIRDRVHSESGVQTVMLVGSHTHHGPVIEIEKYPTPEHSYVRELEEKLIKVIGEANQKLQPAKIAVGRKKLNYNRNRHSKLPLKPIDPELAVIRVDDLKGKPIAIAVNFAAHPTMIDDKIMLFCPDYPGSMKKLVAKEMGGVCLFLQGAAGDLSPNPPPGTRGHVEFGKALGREVIDLAKDLKTEAPKAPSIKTREEDFAFPKMRMEVRSPLIRPIFVRIFYKDLVDFFIEEYKDGVRPHLTVALLNGEIGLVGGSGEFFSNHSVRLKERSRLPHTLFLGYCNDYQQYFPTIEGAAEGGYGADPTVSPVEVGAGEQIMNRGLFHLYDIQGVYALKLFQ